jgi:DNA/RNA-binding domain of Phe-tRNA-synthetase-like protein
MEGAADPSAATPVEGWVAAELAEEFPRLGVVYLTVEARTGKTPAGVRQRLRILSSRFRGGAAVALRDEPVPWAYRVFFHHIGLDPDVTRTPVEQAAVDRLVAGEFRSTNIVRDALLIAVVETGVPLWALDADTIEEPLGIRNTVAGETLGRGPDAEPVTPGRLAVADAAGPLAILFGGLARAHGVRSDTRRMTLFAVRVDGVPSIHVEEALWTCASVLGAA